MQTKGNSGPVAASTGSVAVSTTRLGPSTCSTSTTIATPAASENESPRVLVHRTLRTALSATPSRPLDLIAPAAHREIGQLVCHRDLHPPHRRRQFGDLSNGAATDVDTSLDEAPDRILECAPSGRTTWASAGRASCGVPPSGRGPGSPRGVVAVLSSSVNASASATSRARSALATASSEITSCAVGSASGVTARPAS